MAEFNFRQWPTTVEKNTKKPVDPLAPFHRISATRETVPPSFEERILFIDGKGYDCGCRSTKDYDGKIGEDLGKALGDLLDKAFPILKIPRELAKAVVTLLSKIPIIGPLIPSKKVIEVLDDADPFKFLFGKLGKTLDELLVDSLIRSVPLWVPVLDDAKTAPLMKEMEVEGVLVRSYQRTDSQPLTQWHHWYDWSFKVAPIPLFFNTIGRGNGIRSKNDEADGLNKPGLIRYDSELTPLGTAEEVFSRTIDCEWDLGLLGPRPGPFFNEGADSARDWAWPMTGQFFWASGRSVFDCGHTTNDVKEDGLHLNKLVPCKAIATARFEGFHFKENKKAVPAVQFMFLASNPTGLDFRDPNKKIPLKSAGDFRFSTLQDRDYEFIVDLPELDQVTRATYTMGHTPEFPMNTLILRPRLLIDANVDAFNLGNGNLNRGLRPSVELIEPESPGKPPRQVKVRVPLTQLQEQAGDFNKYGVILSMGWQDPDLEQAKKVKKVTIELQSVQIGADAHESDAEWVMNIGINGRWFHIERKNVKARQKIDLNLPPLVLLLATTDFVQVSVHGMEQDGFGDFFERREIDADAPEGGVQQDPKSEKEGLEAAGSFLKDRLLRFAKVIKVPKSGGAQGAPQFEEINIPFIGKSVQWKEDIEQSNLQIKQRSKAKASEVARAIFLRMATGLAIDSNDILGLIDPDVQEPDPRKRRNQRANDGTDSPNPISVQKIIEEVGQANFKQCRLTGYQTDEMGRMGNLAYNPREPDYILNYQVKVEEQRVGILRIRLFDREGRVLAKAPFVFTSGSRTEKGFSLENGDAVILNVEIPNQCRVRWSRPSPSLDTAETPDKLGNDFEFEHTLFVDFDSKELVTATGTAAGSSSADEQRLSNLGYVHHETLTNNVRAFQRDIGQTDSGDIRDASGKIRELHNERSVPPRRV